MNADTPTLDIPRPSLLTTIDAMRKFAIKGAKDLDVRRKVEEICAQVHHGDYASELLSVYYWTCTHVRYMRDIYDVEFLKEPRVLLETLSGDCDDIATWLAAAARALGNDCEFKVVSFSQPPEPSHVFVVVFTPNGPVTLDPVAGAASEIMTRRITGFELFPVSGYVEKLDVGDSDLDVSTGMARVTYSVYDYRKRCFTYYEGDAKFHPSSWFRAANGPPGVPEVIAARLPEGAVLIGEGDEPKGMVAVLGTGVGTLELGGNGIGIGGIAAVAAVAFLVGRWFGRRP